MTPTPRDSLSECVGEGRLCWSASKGRLDGARQRDGFGGRWQETACWSASKGQLQWSALKGWHYGCVVCIEGRSDG